MKFLIDNALSPKVAAALRDVGHDAVHLRDYGLEAAEDETVLSRASFEERILISADTDFGALLAVSGQSYPSVIIFRKEAGNHPDLQIDLLLNNLPTFERNLDEGTLIIFSEDRIRTRKLPLLQRDT